MVQRMAESSIVIKNYIYEEFCKKKNMEMLCYKVKCRREKWNNISFQSNEKSVENRSGTEYKQILTRLSYEWWN